MPPDPDYGTALVAELRQAGFTFVTGVPDSGFVELIRALDADEFGGFYLPATREDNAVALAVGASLAGATPLVLMESSGFGNVVDVLTSLVTVYEIPLVLFVAWAGYQGRDVPHHNAIGEPFPELLAALGMESVTTRLGAPPAELGSAFVKAREVAQTTRRAAVVLGVPDDLGGEGDG